MPENTLGFRREATPKYYFSRLPDITVSIMFASQRPMANSHNYSFLYRTNMKLSVNNILLMKLKN